MTDVIDLAFHGSSFPSNYTGAGTLIGNPFESNGPTRVSGYFTGSGNAVSIPSGFQPNHIRIADETNVIIWEWFRGQAATHTWKQVTNGTTTVDTGSAIVVSASKDGNCTVTLSATLAASSANISYSFEG